MRPGLLCCTLLIMGFSMAESVRIQAVIASLFRLAGGVQRWQNARIAGLPSVAASFAMPNRNGALARLPQTERRCDLFPYRERNAQGHPSPPLRASTQRLP